MNCCDNNLHGLSNISVWLGAQSIVLTSLPDSGLVCRPNKDAKNADKRAERPLLFKVHDFDMRLPPDLQTSLHDKGSLQVVEDASLLRNEGPPLALYFCFCIFRKYNKQRCNFEPSCDEWFLQQFLVLKTLENNWSGLWQQLTFTLTAITSSKMLRSKERLCCDGKEHRYFLYMNTLLSGWVDRSDLLAFSPFVTYRADNTEKAQIHLVGDIHITCQSLGLLQCRMEVVGHQAGIQLNTRHISVTLKCSKWNLRIWK